jgi:alpha-N-arabinofuranosidase
MYVPHQGGNALRAVFSAPPIQYDRDGKPAEFWGLQGSASIRGKSLVITVVNPSVGEARETELSIPGAKAKSGTVTVLNHSDIHGCNTFGHREAVVPRRSPLQVNGPTLVHSFPPASVSALEIELA